MKYLYYKIAAVVLLFFVAIGIFVCKGLSDYEIVDSSYEQYSVEMPVFSFDSGFYANPIDLTISVPDGICVYYTLDSSDPTEHSIKYDAPIHLKNASNNENVYSMRTDVSTGFYTDLIDKNESSGSAPGYTAPKDKVDKCNVVRAIAVDENGNVSKINTGVYFVGLDSEKYQSINIVSVNTDPANLFDYDYGIYVTGKIFDNYAFKNMYDLTEYWSFWDANYRQRGKAWERPADVTILSSDKTKVSHNSVGLRVQGGISRGTVPRSFNLFSEDKYYTLFNNDYEPTAITLSAGGNKIYTKINDVLMTNFVSELNFANMHFEPCALFLDGEYWGFYWIAERYNADYFEYYYGVDKNNVLMIKTWEVAVGEDDMLDIWLNMVSDISNSDMSKPSEYQHACDIIDMDSFIDYFATLIYIARKDDWPDGNFALWRTLEKKDDKYSDCRWRWILFDCNSPAMSENDVEDDTLSYVINRDSMFASLWKNDTFRVRFQERIFEIADNYLESNKVTEFIDEYDRNMYPFLSDSWKRFHGDNPDIEAYYYRQLESNRQFFKNRRAVVEKWFE